MDKLSDEEKFFVYLETLRLGLELAFKSRQLYRCHITYISKSVYKRLR